MNSPVLMVCDALRLASSLCVRMTFLCMLAVLLLGHAAWCFASEVTLTSKASGVGQVPVLGRSWTLPEPKIALLWVSPGVFARGKPPEFRPKQLWTRLSKGYWLGKTEVTNAQWECVMETSNRSTGSPTLPCMGITWNEAMDFCRKLTLREREAGRLPAGYEYTLPTEAQWEYACRVNAEREVVFPRDCNPYVETAEGGQRPGGTLRDLAWYRETSGDRPHPVGTKRPSPRGFFDMYGNVSEWCRDWDETLSEEGSVDPTGPATGTKKVTHGSDFNDSYLFCTSYMRSASAPDKRGFALGFRLALAPSP